MPFELPHTFVSRRLTLVKHVADETTFFTVDERGEFPVLFPGRLIRRLSSTFVHRVRIDDPGGGNGGPGTDPLHGGVEAIVKVVPLTLKIFTPDGNEFTATAIAVADLRRFRDPRGSPSGPWSFRVTGESEHVFVDEDSTVVNPKGFVGIGVIETVVSESAPPLVANQRIAPTRLAFTFDLFRVGTFVAGISQLLVETPWRGSMRLIDPDGTAVARTTGRTLRAPIGLRTLDKSRDATGKVRKWTLEVTPQAGPLASKAAVSATVIGAGRFAVAALRSRIDALLGPRGQFIRIFGENKDGAAIARLVITDVVSAETIDMHGLLDGALDADEQDGGADIGNIAAGTVYTLARKPQKLAAGLTLDVSTLKVGTIDVTIGPGVRLGGAVPAIRLAVAVTGAAKVKFAGATLATGRIRGGKFDFEVGITLATDGTPAIRTAVPDKPFDIDISTAVKAALLATLGIGGLIGGLSIAEYVEHEINEAVVAGARKLFSEPTIAPRILMTMLGAHLNYLPLRFDGDDIVFDHVAPLEPDPRPTPGYQGAIGRGFTQIGLGAVRFTPALLGDTWRADNLRKIDHIVVVMMENRSYDHVLGYRAAAPLSDGADGLTGATVAAIEAAPNGPFDVRGLRSAGFAANAAGLKTRLPKSVGHELHDVAEQLSLRASGPDGRQINSPKGFVDNFVPHIGSDPQGVVPDDVLGFYDQQDLPVYAHLAEHYAYADRCFCSHPGPTLPNRMYSLTGDVQRDRYGFPILENNNGDNFLLSRAPTVYDVLARKGVTFRVYESAPSVTMLRMFARYATDTTTIVPIERLAADVARNDLPPLTTIEPRMHSHPADDDHPDADMHRGQIFVRSVYETLRSNRALWEKTLLIVTYDEHGGFYDHVVPPLADVIQIPESPVIGLAARGPAGARAAAVASRARPTLLQIPYGVRVPAFVVSPWTPPGKGPSLVLDHCSIVKTVLARFCGGDRPFLSDRIHASHSFDAFLTATSPRLDVPASPKPRALPTGVRRAPSPRTRIVTPPLSRQAMRQGPVEAHELIGRWARQLGR